MPTQAEIQRRNSVKVNPQLAAAQKANANTATDTIISDQASKTQMPGSHELQKASQRMALHVAATKTNSNSYAPQSQFVSTQANSIQTQGTQANNSLIKLAAANGQAAVATASAQAAINHVNELAATAPNSPQHLAAITKANNLTSAAQNAVQAASDASMSVAANPTAQAQQTSNSYTLKDIITRIKTNQPVSTDELAYVIGNEKNSLYAWMILNNPANVNNTMKYKLGVSALPFKPDPKQMMGQVKMWLAGKNNGNLSAITKNFVYNPSAKNWTTSPQLVAYLKQYLSF